MQQQLYPEKKRSISRFPTTRIDGAQSYTSKKANVQYSSERLGKMQQASKGTRNQKMNELYSTQYQTSGAIGSTSRNNNLSYFTSQMAETKLKMKIIEQESNAPPGQLRQTRTFVNQSRQTQNYSRLINSSGLNGQQSSYKHGNLENFKSSESR